MGYDILNLPSWIQLEMLWFMVSALNLRPQGHCSDNATSPDISIYAGEYNVIAGRNYGKTMKIRSCDLHLLKRIFKMWDSYLGKFDSRISEAIAYTPVTIKVI